MSDKDEDVANNIIAGLGCITFFALLPLMVLFHAAVACKIWAWLIEPRFHLGPLTLGAAIGIDLFVSMIRFKIPQKAENTEGSKDLAKFWIRNLLYGVLAPTYFLAVAAIVHLFV